MTKHRHAGATLFSLAAAALLAPAAARAQVRPGSGLPSPRLLVVTPCGARAGTSVEVTCLGLHLENAERLLFSNPAIKAELVPPPPPEIDPKTKKPKPRPPMPGPPPLKFKVTHPPDAPVGLHDVRLVNKWGVSNPRAFAVGDLTEVPEKEPNNDDTQAQRVEINTTINGSITNPADVDYYVFSGKRGQRVVVSCLATSIDSRLQPAVEVYDAHDKQLASNRNYKGYDALADCTLAEDGDYYVRVLQFAHTFRSGLPVPGGTMTPGSDYFYRLTISTTPWIDAVHPCVVEPGKTTTVTVYGRNLPGGKADPTAKADDSVLEKVEVKVTAPTLEEARKKKFGGMLPPSAATVDGFEFRLRNDTGSSNPFLLALASAPVVLDNEANDTADAAQEVTLPCEIAGRIEKRRDRDWYAFTAKKGESWNIEVFSSRLGAPTYMAILLRGATAKNDLYESPFNENMFGYERKFFARSDDPSAYRFTAPADGKYLLLVTSRTGDTLAGPRHYYRVRITRDEPDFRLVALSGETYWPDAPVIYPGGNQALTILAWRNGGFAGDVELSVDGLPPGVTCAPQILGAAVRQTTLVLSATAAAAAWTGEIKVKGTATINGTKVVHEARTGSVVWPTTLGQNFPSLSRFDRGALLAVRDKAPYHLGASADKSAIVQGDKGNIKVKLDRLWPDFKGPLQVQVMQPLQRQGVELPVNLRVNNNQPINLNPGQAEANLPLTIGLDVPPGVYNVVLRGQAQIPYNKDPMAKAKPPTFVVQPSTPVTLTVLPKSLATLSLSNGGPTVKVGGQAEIVVRVARQLGYAGEFKVELVLPPGVAGVTADPVVIPAGANEAKLVLRSPAGTPPGGRGNLTVRAVALYQGKVPTVHEVKFNVNIIK
jgi:hypothetical protein